MANYYGQNLYSQQTPSNPRALSYGNKKLEKQIVGKENSTRIRARP